MRRWPSWTHAWEWTLRAVGLAGIVHETVIVDVERPALVALFGSLVGLPAALAADRARRARRPPPDGSGGSDAGPPPGPSSSPPSS